VSALERAARTWEALNDGRLPRARRGADRYQLLRCPAGHYHRAVQTVEVADLIDTQVCHLHREAA
jgi:hypothetical protein